MAKRTCSVAKCELTVFRREWCTRHYRRWKATGSPLAETWEPKSLVCSIEGCLREVSSKGWCIPHYTQWYRHGDPLKVLPHTTHEKLKRRVTKVCVGCGRTIEVKQSKAASFNFCSLDCKRLNSNAVVVETQCEACGKVMTKYASQIRRTDNTTPWCSRQCQIAGAAVSASCVNCRTVYTLPANMMRVRRSCSRACSQKLRWQWRSAFGSFKQKLESGYRTDIEALAEEVLIELGVRYEFEHRVGRSWIDFALPDLMIGLECDGWQHKNRAEKDADRDATLLAKGWRVVRVLDPALRADARSAILAAIPELLSGETYEPPHEQLGLFA